MRVVDADELSKWISGQIKSPSCPKNESAFGLRIMKHVDRMPSAQPAIRCKDCNHWSRESITDGFCSEDCMRHDEDFYCGYAERRTDE